MHHLEDTQNSKDKRKIAIDKVGVRNLRHPILVKDKQEKKQHTIATVSLSVDLPEHFKGTHMSRFVEVLNSYGRELNVNKMSQVPKKLLEKLHAKNSHVEFRFPYFRTKYSPITKKPGLIDTEVIFDFEAQKGLEKTKLKVSVIVPVSTLCPCSRAISARGAHNQRGEVTFSVCFEKPIWIEDLLEIVEKSASCELFSLLKRPDEKFVTEKAYDNPVFVEDLVRNIAQKAKKHPKINWFNAKAENFESIHNHNAFAIVKNF